MKITNERVCLGLALLLVVILLINAIFFEPSKCNFTSIGYAVRPSYGRQAKHPQSIYKEESYRGAYSPYPGTIYDNFQHPDYNVYSNRGMLQYPNHA